MYKILLFTILVLLPSIGAAQNSLDVRPIKEDQTVRRHVLPQVPKHQFTYDIYYDRLVEEYEQRMKANVRKHKKVAKELTKPQYSDFSYFGHKRKPKKRPVGKRKFCQECEIVH